MKPNVTKTMSGAGGEVSVWGRAAPVTSGHCNGWYTLGDVLGLQNSAQSF